MLTLLLTSGLRRGLVLSRATPPTVGLRAAFAAAATAERAAPTKREQLPKGLLSREVAISVGVGLALVALLISFLSVRAASMRRLVDSGSHFAMVDSMSAVTSPR